jgi:hypothetical protein
MSWKVPTPPRCFGSPVWLFRPDSGMAFYTPQCSLCSQKSLSRTLKLTQANMESLHVHIVQIPLSKKCWNAEIHICLLHGRRVQKKIWIFAIFNWMQAIARIIFLSIKLILATWFVSCYAISWPALYSARIIMCKGRRGPVRYFYARST